MNQVVFQFVHLGADASVQLGLRGFQGRSLPAEITFITASAWVRSSARSKGP
ncbi:MAG: hypothetical protein ACLT8C_02800 [Akkermansia muciniphila]